MGCSCVIKTVLGFAFVQFMMMSVHKINVHGQFSSDLMMTSAAVEDYMSDQSSMPMSVPETSYSSSIKATSATIISSSSSVASPSSTASVTPSPSSVASSTGAASSSSFALTPGISEIPSYHSSVSPSMNVPETSYSDLIEASSAKPSARATVIPTSIIIGNFSDWVGSCHPDCCNMLVSKYLVKRNCSYHKCLADNYGLDVTRYEICPKTCNGCPKSHADNISQTVLHQIITCLLMTLLVYLIS